MKADRQLFLVYWTPIRNLSSSVGFRILEHRYNCITATYILVKWRSSLIPQQGSI